MKLIRSYQSQRVLQKTNLFLGNIHSLASLIQSQFATSRRASVPISSILRLFAAAVIRRIQPSESTTYSIQFDTAIASIIPIVPAVFNTFFGCVPPRGQFVSRGETIIVEPTNPDYDENFFYITSSLFASDMLAIKAFAQAQGAAFVPLNFNGPFTHPSVTLRAVGSSLTTCTMPIEGRTLTEEISYTQYLSDNLIGYVKRTHETNVAGVTVEMFTYSEERAPSPKGDELAAHKVLVLVNKEAAFVPGTEPHSPSYHVSGIHGDLDTESKQLSAVIPLLQFTEVPLSSDPLDIVLGTPTWLQFEDPTEYWLLWLATAINRLINRFVGVTVTQLQYVSGSPDTRTGVQSPAPSQGTPPAPQPYRERPISDATANDLGTVRDNHASEGVASSTAASAANNGLTRPSYPGPQRSGGNRKRGSSTQASAVQMTRSESRLLRRILGRFI